MSKNIRVGISIGDLNGIGPEIVLKSLSDLDFIKNITPILYASESVCEYFKKELPQPDFNYTVIENPIDAKHHIVNVINVWDEAVSITPGQPTKVSGEKALASLQAVVDDLINQRIDVLVTAPIDKNNIQSESFNFPGHTEYLSKMSNTEEALMFLVADNLRVGVLTGHIPLQAVPSMITQESIIKKLSQMNKSLKEDFGIAQPKIAVMGLNPHAGDRGLIGSEEIDILIPAIEKANSLGMETKGPYAADGIFGSSVYQQFDGILAMYHDQGLIPFKVMAFDTGVNFTAGLPIVRTSPDHGTAFDIAGKNIASDTSFRNALHLAIDIFNKRRS